MDNSIQSFLIAVLPLQTAYNMENLLFQPAADFQDAPHGGEEICRDCLVAFVVRQDGGSGNDQGTPNLTK